MGKRGLSILIYLYIILLPLLPYKLKFNFIPINGDAILAAILLLYVLLIILSKYTRNNFLNGLRDFFHNYFSIFVFVLFALMFISITYSQYKTAALSESIRFSTYIILYFIIKYEVNDRKAIDNILRCFIITASLLCIIGLAQIFTRIGVSGFIYHGTYGTRVRVPSTLGNPNSFGGLLILAIFPVIMLAINEKVKKVKVFYFLCSVLIFLNIILTESRNAWLGLAIGAVTLAIVYNIKLIFAFLGIGGAALLIPQISTRVKEFTDMSQNIGRLQLWKIALIIAKQHPVRGIGNGNYQKLYSYYVTKYPELRYNDHKEFEVHNNFLKIQSELGFLGLVAFLGMLVSTVIRLKKLVNEKIDIKYVVFFKGFIASVIAFAFMNLSDDFFLVPKIAAYFWIIVAASEAIQYKIQDYLIN